MRISLHRVFVLSAIVILTLTAAAKLFSTTGTAGILNEPDPLLPMTYRQMLLCAAILELAAAGYLAVNRNRLVNYLSIIWLSITFILYRVGLWLVGVDDYCLCLGTVTARLRIEPAAVDHVLKAVILYFLVGGFCLFAQEWRQLCRVKT